MLCFGSWQDLRESFWEQMLFPHYVPTDLFLNNVNKYWKIVILQDYWQIAQKIVARKGILPTLIIWRIFIPALHIVSIKCFFFFFLWRQRGAHCEGASVHFFTLSFLNKNTLYSILLMQNLLEFFAICFPSQLLPGEGDMFSVAHDSSSRYVFALVFLLQFEDKMWDGDSTRDGFSLVHCLVEAKRGCSKCCFLCIAWLKTFISL